MGKKDECHSDPKISISLSQIKIHQMTNENKFT